MRKMGANIMKTIIELIVKMNKISSRKTFVLECNSASRFNRNRNSGNDINALPKGVKYAKPQLTGNTKTIGERSISRFVCSKIEFK
jgi:hypothetical protein